MGVFTVFGVLPDGVFFTALLGVFTICLGVPFGVFLSGLLKSTSSSLSSFLMKETKREGEV